MISSRLIAILAFTVGLVMLAAVEVIARRPESRVPSLAQMCGFVMRYRVGIMPVGRIAVFGFWWWLGWHFFAR